MEMLNTNKLRLNAILQDYTSERHVCKLHDGRGFGMELCFTLHPCMVLRVPKVFLCAA
jgi:hypothetical protein